MITEGDEFITTYIIDSNFSSMKGGASYSDCLLSLINVTEISLTNRTVGELLWENISYSKSGISDH